MKRLVPLLVLVSLLAVTASATTLRRFTLEEVRDRAESIFVGRVVSSSVRPIVNGQLVATDYTIEVQEVLAGKVAATTTVTYVPGAPLSGIGAPGTYVTVVVAATFPASTSCTSMV